MEKKEMLDFIDEKQDVFSALSDKIWDYAEIAYAENSSAEAICQSLESFGFKVDRGIADIPTAFRGTFGSGKPVIGFLGEFDALPSLSQKENSEMQEEIIAGGNGHGCGHNMLGAGAMAAAVALKEYLEKNQKEGTVVYYGCPAEEGGSGKAFMARDGIFNNLDAALTWHPSAYNLVVGVSLLANYQIDYHFKGIASHAAAAPHLGRSALDAVELMNVGANYLREHIIQEARMHYAILDAGGTAPNVVQPHATVTYLVRAPKNYQVQEIYERLNKVAQGAAQMTETDLTISFGKACSNIVNNVPLEKQLQKNFEEIGTPEYTSEEIAFAEKMNNTISLKSDGMISKMLGPDFSSKIATQDIVEEVAPYVSLKMAAAGSSDVGDVSWNTPTAQITVACYSKFTPEHSWQLVAQGKSSTAHKGLMTAAKVLAATAVDLVEDPELLKQAREAFLRELDGHSYDPAIPADKKAPIPQKS